MVEARLMKTTAASRFDHDDARRRLHAISDHPAVLDGFERLVQSGDFDDALPPVPRPDFEPLRTRIHDPKRAFALTQQVGSNADEAVIGRM